MGVGGSSGVFPLAVGAGTVWLEIHVDVTALTADYSSIVSRKGPINRCISTLFEGIDILTGKPI